MSTLRKSQSPRKIQTNILQPDFPLIVFMFSRKHSSVVVVVGYCGSDWRASLCSTQIHTDTKEFSSRLLVFPPSSSSSSFAFLMALLYESLLCKFHFTRRAFIHRIHKNVFLFQRIGWWRRSVPIDGLSRKRSRCERCDTKRGLTSEETSRMESPCDVHYGGLVCA